MLKFIVLAILVHLCGWVYGFHCDIKFCNHNGLCMLVNGKPNCTCFDPGRADGIFCNIYQNPCDPNPCQNNGVCRRVGLEYYCSKCADGWGGINCDVDSKGMFKDLVIVANSYAYYADRWFVLLSVTDFGALPIKVQISTPEYLIDSFYIDRRDTSSERFFRSCSDLPRYAKRLGIHNTKGLYKGGLYHARCGTFFEVGLKNITVQVVKLDDPTQVLYEKLFKVYIIRSPGVRCLPSATLRYGKTHTKPVELNVAVFTAIETENSYICSEHSKLSYCPSFCSADGRYVYKTFNCSTESLFFIKPYDFLIKSKQETGLYMLNILVREIIGDVCFRKVLRLYINMKPQRLQADIAGGSERTIGYRQALLLDGFRSRDWTQRADGDLHYQWDCSSDDDPKNPYCVRFQGSRYYLIVPSMKLKPGCKYVFNLTVQSKAFSTRTNSVEQHINVVEENQLIIYVHNGVRNLILSQQIDVGRNMIMQAVCLNCAIERSIQYAICKYKWTIGDNDELIGTKQIVHYKPTKEEDLKLKLEVSDRLLNMKGTYRYTFKLNKKPEGDECTIDPTSGSEYFTKFVLSCPNFKGDDGPYTYRINADTMPIRYSKISTIGFALPVDTKEIIVRICSVFSSCAIRKVPVNVKKGEIDTEDLSFIDFLRGFGIKESLRYGDVTKTLILIDMVFAEANFAERKYIIEEMKDYVPRRNLHVTQYCWVIKKILGKIGSLNAKYLSLINILLNNLLEGFKYVREVGVSEYLTPSAHEFIGPNLLNILSHLTEKTQYIMPTVTYKWHSKQVNNLLLEEYDELPILNTLSAERVHEWKETLRLMTLLLHEFGAISSVANLFGTSDESIDFNVPGVQLRLIGSQHMGGNNFDHTHTPIKFNFKCEIFMKCNLNRSLTVHQLTYLDGNPFWWAPKDNSLGSRVIMISIFNRFGQTIFNLMNQYFTIVFAYDQFPKDIPIITKDLKGPDLEEAEAANNQKPKKLMTSEGILAASNERHLYFVKYPFNAHLGIQFEKISKPLRLFFAFDRIPSSYELRQSKERVIIHQGFTGHYYYFKSPNITNKKTTLYIAIMAYDPVTEPVSYAFKVVMIACYRFDFLSKDPHWNTDNCRVADQNDTHITCECNHLSAFAATTKLLQVDVDKAETTFFYNLSYNPNAVWFYALFFCFIIFTIAYISFFKHKPNVIILIDQHKPSLTDGFLICMTTGNFADAGTSSNLYMRFETPKGIYKGKVYQDDFDLFAAYSTTIFHISSRRLATPFILEIRIDKHGRYPSWFCEFIKVIDITDNYRVYDFYVRQWINTEAFTLDSSEAYLTKRPSKISQVYFRLVTVFTNWFKLQPILGPFIYGETSMNLVQRACIFFIKFSVVFAAVVIYYGPTTVQNYEEERITYRHLTWDISKMVIVVVVCFIINSFIHISFYILR